MIDLAQPGHYSTEVFTFQFFSDKIYIDTKKSHLALGNLAKLVFWSVLSFVYAAPVIVPCAQSQKNDAIAPQSDLTPWTLTLALQYKPLYNINRSEKWGKKIQIAGYNGAHVVFTV